ncbi:acylglycerol kinase, mitochondrial [Sitophilus oryzae]|uniref:Acylglycerol kinase, mitochondrial n=1 Tax=Sitophilus oryzae TaxID=7048 RepID=A0A6J2Y832_SITOR|nr:acylglycerol kinase, mitochondrial [Sitophilus oryzae]XP_030759988.1 acylglycerol kinase, mitochondrial [Sitophilus oryzae]
MAFVLKTYKTLRNNWKKSTFFAIVLGWGGSYTKNYLETENLMRAYCKKASEYGNQTIPVTANPRSVTVILNPKANKRKAQSEFEKYCAPLLHLAGLKVELVKTESEGHGKSIIDKINGPEALVVAGGDGTLSEVITGLLRRTNENVNNLVPLGILPLGRNNSLSQSLFPNKTKLNRVKSLADATMAIIEEHTKPVDVLRIEILTEEEKRPIYAMSGIKWGAYRDAEVMKESYWYFGGLKKYVTYLLNGLKTNLAWNCQAQVYYSPPCAGCSNCYQGQQSQSQSKWFQNFIKGTDESRKYQYVNNPYCNEKLERNISTTDFNIFTSNVIPSRISDTDIPKIQLYIGPPKVDYVDFVRQGWKYENDGSREIEESIEARTIEIDPKLVKGQELWFSIDNEDYEAKPIKVTLLPRLLKMYCSRDILINK